MLLRGRLVDDGGDLRKCKSRNGEKRSDEIEEHDRGKPHGGVEEDAEGRRAYAGNGGEQLVERVDAQEVLVGHQHGHGRHHRRAVEGLADSTRHTDEDKQHERDIACEDDESRYQRDESDGAVGHDHDHLAVVLVGHDAAKRGEKADGEHHAYVHHGKHERAAGGFGHVPYDGIPRGVAGYHRDGLTGPYEADDCQPVLGKGQADGAREGRVGGFGRFSRLHRRV